jgi:hypothetical protein
MLGNSIALLTLAVMLASEGKRADGWWRPGLYTLAAAVALVALALEPITRELPAVGGGLTAVFGNPLSWFVLAISLFFVLRPFWQTRAASRVLAQIQENPIDGKEALSERVGQLSSSMGALRDLLRQEKSAVTQRLRKIEDKISALDRTHKTVQHDSRQQFISLYDALNAIHQRERMDELATQIESRAASLRGPTENRTELDEDEWEAWEVDQRAWRSVLEEWCSIAECYSPGIKEKILLVLEDDLQATGVAQVGQFHSPEAFLIYKGFNIRFKNWLNWREDGRKAVTLVSIRGTANSRPIT